MADVTRPLADQTGITTGSDAQDEQARLAALVEAEIKKHNLVQQAQGQGLTQADLEKLLAKGDSPKPEYKVTIGGQTYTYESAEAMNAAIGQALEAAVLRGQQLAQTQPAATGGSATSAPTYDEKQFEQILATQGTPAALAYALRFSDVNKELEMLRSQNAALRMKQTAAEVKEIVPGFKPKDAREVAIVDSIRNEFGGAPDNPRAWEAAVATAVSRGLIKLESAAQAPAAPGQSSYPGVGGNGGAVSPPFMGNTQGQASPDLAKRHAELMELPLEAIARLRAQIGNNIQ